MQKTVLKEGSTWHREELTERISFRMSWGNTIQSGSRNKFHWLDCLENSYSCLISKAVSDNT
jgi:hypothetical protein